jgi:hypothetical protein
MSPLENNLKTALRRRNAPDGFAERVMERISRAPEPQSVSAALSRKWMAVAAAGLIAIMSAGVWEYGYAQQRRAQAEQATAELVYALQVTSAKLNFTKEKLEKTTKGWL